MKVLVVEDTALKYAAIGRALKQQGRSMEIVRVKSLDSARELLGESDSGEFQLIVTDMRFPEENYGQELLDAGFQLIEYVRRHRPGIPVIICSTSKFVEEDDCVVGAVQYRDNVDLRMEFKKIFDEKL